MDQQTFAKQTTDACDELQVLAENLNQSISVYLNQSISVYKLHDSDIMQ